MMDTSKFKGHTPRPWNCTRPTGDRFSIDSYDYGRVAVASKRGAPRTQERLSSDDDDHGRQEDVMQANAKLMAAAPDLLAEVERLQAENSRLQDRISRAIDCIDTFIGDTDPQDIDYSEHPEIRAMHILLDKEDEKQFG